MQRRRVFWIFAVLAVLFASLGARLAWMQAVDRHYYRELADDLHKSTRFTSAPRGRILDRRGRVLAEDEPEHAVAFTLKDVIKTRWVARRVVRVCSAAATDEAPFPYTEELLFQSLELIRHGLADELGTDRAIAPRPWLENLAPEQALAMRRELATPTAPLLYPGVELVENDGDFTLTVAPKELFAGEAGVRRLERRLGELGRRVESPLFDFVEARYNEMRDPESILLARLEEVTARLEAADRAESETELDDEDRTALEHRAEQLRVAANDPAVIGQLRQQWFEREYELWPDLPFELVEEIEYFPDAYSGLVVHERRRRVNRSGDALSNLIGTVGEPTREVVERWVDRGEPVVDSWYRSQGRLFGLQESTTFLALRDVAHHSTDTVGMTGLERQFEERLRARPGARNYQFDVTGRPYGPALWEEPPLPGRDLNLTIDSELCDLIASRLREMQPVPYGASVLVADAQNGEILAWVTHPGHDPNRSFDTQEEYEAYQRSRPGGAFLDRPRASVLPPGSIFKVVVALAALVEGVVSPHEQITCNGCYDPRNPDRLRCRNNAIGAELDLEEALALSCNVYFYIVGGDRVGAAGIARWGETFKIWAPSPSWMPPTARATPPERRSQPQMAAMGQGFTVTPLGMLRFALGLANRGTFVVPRLIQEAPIEPPDTIPLVNDAWELVIGGMEAAVDHGTARWKAVGLYPFDCAVKTGTAEKVYRDRLPDGTWSPAERKNVGWLIGFAPVREPKVVFVLDIERTDHHGGDACGPIAASILEWLEAERGLRLRLSAAQWEQASRTRGAPHGASR